MNVLLPLAGGVIGSLATIFAFEIKNKVLPKKVRAKYMFIGAIAGFIAVNLLNPEGGFTIKAPLAILFGLSPMSFLKAQSFFNEGDETFEQYSQGIKKYQDLFEKGIDSFPEGEEDKKKLREKIKEMLYNEDKGEDGDE